MAEPDRSERLLELATARFGEGLTAADRRLFQQAANGNVAHYGDGDPADAANWGSDRVLQVDRIRWLCTDPEAVKEVSHKGIQMIGARIEGDLDLSFAKIEFPLAIVNSAIRRGITLQRSHLHVLNLDGTHIGPMSADGLRVDHGLFMRKAFRATGEVRLVGATIGGNLECDNSQFCNPDGWALDADGVDVKGGVFLRDGFRAAGEVRLLGAKIGGDFSCTNGHFSNRNGDALSADGIMVGGAVFLDKGFQATGGVRLPCATIGRILDCGNGHYSNPNRKALNADGIKVEGGVFLREGFQAEGEVRLLGATLGGDLDCSKGHFSNPNGEALTADRIKVGGGVFLREGFQAEGEVNLLGATIRSDLSCIKGHFSNPNGRALSADSIEVEGSVFLRGGFKAEGNVDFSVSAIGRSFQWRDVDGPERCTLRLESARIGTLWDDEGSWPKKLYLDGLVYDRLYKDAPMDAKARMQWLARQGSDRFLPQPYMQLASVLKEMGHEADAREILIGKVEDPARLKAMTRLQWVWHHVLRCTIRHGYQPWLALIWMLGFLVVGSVLFSRGFANERLSVTTNDPPPSFVAIVYSLDTFLPLIDLHQAKYWLPTGWPLRAYHWIHIAFGWVLSTLLAVGMTGLVRR